MHVYDFDGDGNPEVALGLVMVDDNGKATMWTSGLGHQDVFYVADIIPNRLGFKIGRMAHQDCQSVYGIQVADATMGRTSGGHPNPTSHIHDWGIFADIDASSPCNELYAAEQNRMLQKVPRFGERR